MLIDAFLESEESYHLHPTIHKKKYIDSYDMMIAYYEVSHNIKFNYGQVNKQDILNL